MTGSERPAIPFLRLLFWLKWRLLTRGYKRSVASIIGLVVALLVFLPIVLGGAFLLGAGFVKLPPPFDADLLRGVLLGIYVIWLLAPLLGFALNDSYDITRLFAYPVSVRQIFTGAILGSLLDFPTLLLIPLLFSVLVGFSTSIPAFVLVFAAVALFLFHTLALSQAVLLATAGVLRSRRFRDIALVLVPLFWMTYYVLSQTLRRSALEKVDWPRFLRSPAWEAVNLLPSGLAARAAAAAGLGQWGTSLGFLFLLATVTGGTVFLAGWLIQKVFDGEHVGFAPRPAKTVEARRSAPAPRPAAAASFTAKLPPVVAAIVDKEMKYLVRDPYFKIALMNLVYMIVVGVVVFFNSSRGLGRGVDFLSSGSPWMLGGLSSALLLSEMQLVFNIFGNDGSAASFLFAFPADRRQILVGKNLVLFGALSLVNIAALAILCGVARAAWLFLPLLAWMTMGLVVLIAVGNLSSVWFPTRVVLKGWKMRQQGASKGCGYSLLYLGVALTAAVLLVPVLAALALPVFFVGSAWLALSVPLALIYSAGLYLVSLRLAGPLLIAREIEMIGKLSHEE